MATLEDNTKPIIFQEFISYNKGRDIRCLVVGNKLVASMVRKAKAGFKANVHQGTHHLDYHHGCNADDMMTYDD